MDSYVTGRRAAGTKAKTVNKELDLLRASINSLCPGAPNPFAKYGRLREDDSRMVEALPLEVVARYLAVATGWVKDQLLFIATTGARLSTLRQMRLGDVRWQADYMRLPLWKTSQSTHDRYTDVPIPKTLREMLIRLTHGKAPEKLRFPYRVKAGLQKALNSLARRHTLPHAHPHQFRHTWATETLKRTGGIKAVMEIGG